MRIAIGSDHRGVRTAAALATRLEGAGHRVRVLGEHGGEPCDYPDQAYLVAKAVRDGAAERGVLVCGSGIGMAMAANKVNGVRAVVATDEQMAVMSRLHNDANVICIAADRTDDATAGAIVDTWLATAFEGGRHQRRVNKIDAILRGEDPTAIHDAVADSRR